MLSIKKSKIFKKMIISSLVVAPLTSLAFIPSISQKMEKQNCSLVQIKNDKSSFVDKPILYQFETEAINYFPNTIPLKYEKIDWNLPFHVLVNSLDSFDGKNYFKDYLTKLAIDFDCLPDIKQHTFITVINLINNLENSLKNKIEYANFQIEYYKKNKEKLLGIFNTFAKENNFDDLDVSKMNLSKIKQIIVNKFDISGNELDDLTYDELINMCKSNNTEAIKQIDETIQFCEAYKTSCESKLSPLNTTKQELINSLNNFANVWKKNNNWYKNFDSEKEMLDEMKKDYEKNKKIDFGNAPKVNLLHLFSLVFSNIEKDPLSSFSFNFLWN